MVGGLRLSFPKLFELTLVCCSVCAPRLTLTNYYGVRQHCVSTYGKGIGTAGGILRL